MYVIGLDIGTTGAKALLTDERGNVISKGYRGYPLISDGCRIEQRAQDWTEAGSDAIRQAMDGHEVTVDAISLSTQGASTVAVDKDMRPIGNALTWMDSRAIREAADIEEKFGGAYIYEMSGWRINPAFDAAKILWMKRRPEYAGAAMYLSTLEFVNVFLTGRAVIDPTNASIRQLFNIQKADWEDEMLRYIGITRSELPECENAGVFLGGLGSAASQATGLRQGTPVYNGAHDQYCASIGAGAVHAGDMLLSAGTTWVVMGISEKPLFTDTFIAPGIHPIEGLYGNIASLTCSGASLEWYKDKFEPGSFQEMDREAEKRAGRQGELFFYPYMTGANYPVWNLKAKGAFTGVELSCDRFDFALAIMEGAAFGVRRTVDDFLTNGCRIERLKIMGGAAKSAFWCSMIANAANVGIAVSAEPDACALGAAVIAACGCGCYPDYAEACKHMVGKQTLQSPDAQEAKRLNARYENYTRMWNAMEKYYQ